MSLYFVLQNLCNLNEHLFALSCIIAFVQILLCHFWRYSQSHTAGEDSCLLTSYKAVSERPAQLCNQARTSATLTVNMLRMLAQRDSPECYVKLLHQEEKCDAYSHVHTPAATAKCRVGLR